MWFKNHRCRKYWRTVCLVLRPATAINCSGSGSHGDQCSVISQIVGSLTRGQVESKRDVIRGETKVDVERVHLPRLPRLMRKGPARLAFGEPGKAQLRGSGCTCPRLMVLLACSIPSVSDSRFTGEPPVLVLMHNRPQLFNMAVTLSPLDRHHAACLELSALGTLSKRRGTHADRNLTATLCLKLA